MRLYQDKMWLEEQLKILKNKEAIARILKRKFQKAQEVLKNIGSLTEKSVS